MGKKNKEQHKVYQIASDFIGVLYKIFRSMFVLIPISSDRIKRMFRFSLSFKISMVYTMLIFLALLFFSTLMLIFFTITAGKETFSIINRSIDHLHANIEEHSLDFITSEQTHFISTGHTHLYVYDHHSLSVFSTNNAPAAEFRRPVDQLKFYLTHSEEGFLMIVTRSFYNNNEHYYIMGAFEITEFIRYFVVLGLILLAMSLLIFILLPAYGFRLSKKMLLPIRKMTEDAREITLFNLDKRLDVARSQDELKDLSETFNETLDRLQNSYEKQYQFISDASHELRTPISVIQGYANLLTRWGKDDKEVLEESVTAIKNESENMKDLIEKLLFIARSESHNQPLDKSLFSINELLKEVIKEYQICDTTHHFTLWVEGNLSLYADRKLIKQTIRIFTDNAVKYTPEGGTISLSATMENQKLIFMIKDTGIGISEDDLPKIFNRFYRADSSRDKKSGGSGLGLSIAKVILDLHEAKIKVFSTPGKGTEVQLLFPIKETLRYKS